jgi:protein-S-isoprenylcysteine O-methyltransferase Ste14
MAPTPEFIARFSVAALLAGAMAIGIPHRVRADRAGGRVSRRHDPAWFWGTMAVVGPLLLLSFVAFVVNPRWLDWSAVPVPAWMRIIGLPLGLAALAGFKWMFTHLGANVTSTSMPRAGATLVTSGPYRWVRHPMYAIVALLSLATALLTASWFIAVCGLSAFVMLAARSRLEERRLVETFGDAYRRYQRTTPRLLPRVRR